MARKQLKELRKELKPLGYKVKTESMLWGRHATYVHIESGEELKQNVFTPRQYKIWEPLFNYLHSLPERTELWNGDEKIYGSKFNKKD